MLDGKEPFDALVYVKADERLSDLMNDQRPFLPVRCADGSVLMVAKTQIASIIERDLTEAEQAARDLTGAVDPHSDETAHEIEEAARIRAAEDVRRRAVELERLRAEIEAKRAAAKGAAGHEPPTAGSDDGATDAQQDAESGSAASRGDASDEASQSAQRPKRPRRAFDAYAMLRVRRGASAEEIKKAYKTRIKAVHPDIIASLDLDEDVVRAMHLTAQRINQAYDRIMRELDRAEESAAENLDSEQSSV